MQVQMRRVRTVGVETVFVLADLSGRNHGTRAGPAPINEKQEGRTPPCQNALQTCATTLKA